MSLAIVVPDVDFSAASIASKFPFSADIRGYWLFGTDALASQENLVTGEADSFTGSPTFTSNSANLGAPAGLATGIQFDGPYTMVYVGTLPIVAGQVAALMGFYPTAGGTGIEAIFNYDASIRHTNAGSTSGTLSRTLASDGTMSGVRAVIATFDLETCALHVKDGNNLLSVTFPRAGSNIQPYPMLVGGRTSDTLTAGFDANAAMVFDRALTLSEIEGEILPYLISAMANRGVTLA
ncbi:hypothetical protein [Qipengyuania huizhouensis]|uniref:hypothetical protein n=1 Tax=Qipengyuania huizhouensis TaxID=2867245 RepID=UPI001C86CDB4|nr:hypothetical protein [Qipengyuania huizhouensis]MBX7459566.1 hypothetical protein [Qipengyuania huizhouensis]